MRDDAMTELSTGALEGWLTTTAPEQPRNEAAPDPAAPDVAGVTPATAVELVAIGEELACKRGIAELQRDPAWLEVLSPAEQDSERKAAEKIRGMRRDQHVHVATAAVRLAGRERRAERRVAGVELSDRIWQRRALARRTRLCDPTSRLASLHRIHLGTTSVLLALAGAGIGWTSVGVHDALVGPTGSALAYVVEPLFSLALLVIMAVGAVAAQWAATSPPGNTAAGSTPWRSGCWPRRCWSTPRACCPGWGSGVTRPRCSPIWRRRC